MILFNAAETERLLDYPCLMAALEGVLLEYQRGEILCPERLVLPCGDQGGMLLSMPCSAHDVTAHKLITLYSGNPSRGLPAINGHVVCIDTENGVPLFFLDGPTVTARRTAAITMLGLKYLCAAAPTSIYLIGTGVQAEAHARAALALYSDLIIYVQGRSTESALALGRRIGRPDRIVPASVAAAQGCDAVISITNSVTPVYDEQAAPGRLVIGAGAHRLDMVEIGANAIAGSQIYVDDLMGARAEAGDLLAAGIDWAHAKPLAASLTQKPDFEKPIFFKSVGCAAWDLAACRAARGLLS